MTGNAPKQTFAVLSTGAHIRLQLGDKLRRRPLRPLGYRPPAVDPAPVFSRLDGQLKSLVARSSLHYTLNQIVQ